MAFQTGICVFAVPAAAEEGGHSAADEGAPNELDMISVMRRIWEFSTHRRNVPHRLAYQLLMPAIPFRVVSVLGNRCEHFGFDSEKYAIYGVPFVALVLPSRLGADNKRPLALSMRFYYGEAVVIAGLLAQYCGWSVAP